MDDSNRDVFYECPSPSQTPPLEATKKFYLPLSTPSIYCRQNGSPKVSTKTSLLPQHGPLDINSDSTITNKVLSLTHVDFQSSVVESCLDGHMTDLNLTSDPTTPPSTPTPSNVGQAVFYEDGGSYVVSSPTPDTPPLSPSSSISTSLSEPSTPTRSGSIDPHRFSTSPQSNISSHRNKYNDSGPLVAGLLEWKNDDTTPQIPPTPTPKSSTGRAKNRNALTLTAKKNTIITIRRRKIPKSIPQPGPFIPEGLHTTQFPAADEETIIIPDTLEAGHIIAYGTCPVPATRLEIARQRRRILKNKVRHYGMDDEVKNVRSSGSVSGESETSEESGSENSGESESVRGGQSGFAVVIWKEGARDGGGEEDVFVDALTEVEVEVD